MSRSVVLLVKFGAVERGVNRVIAGGQRVDFERSGHAHFKSIGRFSDGDHGFGGMQIGTDRIAEAPCGHALFSENLERDIRGFLVLEVVHRAGQLKMPDGAGGAAFGTGFDGFHFG